MNILVIVLRLLHIVSGVFWVGAALINAFFLSPAVTALGETGRAFMAHLVQHAKLSVRVTIASYLTVLAGVALYWIDSQGFRSAWLTSGPGIGFGVGALAAFVGFGFGQMVGKSASTVARIASEIRGAPTPEQASALARASQAMESAGRTSTAALILALLLMATARYLVF